MKFILYKVTCTALRPCKPPEFCKPFNSLILNEMTNFESVLLIIPTLLKCTMYM